MKDAFEGVRPHAITGSGNHDCKHGGRCPDCDCPNDSCACVLRERVAGAEKRERKAVMDAAHYRQLWLAAASYLQFSRAKLAKPRGTDERRMLDHAMNETCGPFGSGRTNGWLAEADLIPAATRIAPASAVESPRSQTFEVHP